MKIIVSMQFVMENRTVSIANAGEAVLDATATIHALVEIKSVLNRKITVSNVK